MTYTTLARIPSSSSSATYEVATEGTHLSCNCPGWTRQTHYHGCPAVIGGGKCECRNPSWHSGPKDARVCKHTREIQPFVTRVGGLACATELCRNGTDIRYVGRGTDPVGRARTATPTPRCTVLGCQEPRAIRSEYCSRHAPRYSPPSPPRRSPRAVGTAARLQEQLAESARRLAETVAAPTPRPTREPTRPGRAIRIREEED